MRLPTEIIEVIVLHPVLVSSEQFIVASSLRYTHIYVKIVPTITSASPVSLSRKGLLDGLQWWKESGLEMVFPETTQWKESGLFSEPTQWRENGLFPEPTQWKENDLDMVFPEPTRFQTIDLSTLVCGPQEILLPLTSKKQIVCIGKRFESPLDYASCYGHTAVLNWWKESGLGLKYSEYTMDWASRNGHISVLDWWKESGLRLAWSEAAMDYASENGHVSVLEWWKQSGLSLKYSENAMYSASQGDHVSVLDWWKQSGLELKWCKRSTPNAGSEISHKWWKESGLLQ